MKRYVMLFLGIALISIMDVVVYAGGRNFQAYKVSSAPTIDGIGNDTCWLNAQWYPINILWQGTAVDSLDFYGRFKVAWNAQKLFVLVEINDNILSDMYSDPLVNYYMDDCVELFIDENHSGGDHQDNFNAFAYHVSTLGDVVDLGTDASPHLFNDVLQVVRTNIGDLYTWEFAVNIYTDSYVLGGTNVPLTLTADKIMGFSVAYCDDDSSGTRETFMGSDPNSNGGDNHWINASEFATLTLLDTTIHTSAINEVSDGLITVYPNPVNEFLYFSSDDNLKFENRVQIYNEKGLLVKNTIVKSENDRFSLYVGDLVTGIYFVEIGNKNNFITQKIIVR
jgi:hypothetical protein